MSQAFDELMKRPKLTQAEAGYQSMFQTIRERLVAEVGVAEWVPDEEPISGSSCGGGLSNLEGAEVRRYDAGMSPGNLPDARWELAVAIVTEVSGQYGFGAPKVIVSGPGDHEVSFRNTYNGELLFGTGANTILGGSTGCHLTEEAHQRGAYLPPKKY
jgi:Lipoprotein confined to pathogenic Mycobacterium